MSSQFTASNIQNLVNTALREAGVIGEEESGVSEESILLYMKGKKPKDITDIVKVSGYAVADAMRRIDA